MMESTKSRKNNNSSSFPEIDSELLIGNVAEIVPNQLYFACFNEDVDEQVINGKISYVSFHQKFHYEPFYMDFGPWNLSVLYRLCIHIDNHIQVEERRGRRIVAFCCDRKNGEFEKIRVNCAYVLASYLIIYHGKSADDAFLTVSAGQPPKYIGFRDASLGEPSYLLHLHDVLRGVEKALKHNWLDFTDFDYQEYEYYEKVENGDFNWIIPNKILSFCGPHNESRVEEGYPFHSPEVYFKYFKKNNVTTIVRLNAKNYDAKKFTRAGFDHVDLFFLDGSVPSDEIVEQFIKVVDTAKGGVAVHCKAGLGRTGTLIACWMMKEYGITASECMAWLRICRPGSVIGPQQRFLIEKQKMCWSLSKSNGVVTHVVNKNNKEKKSMMKKLTNQVDSINLRETKLTRPNILPLRRKPITISHETDKKEENDETALDEKGRSQGDRLLALKAKHQHEKEHIVQPLKTRNQYDSRRYVKENDGTCIVPSQAYLNRNREVIMPNRNPSAATTTINNSRQLRSPNGNVAYRVNTGGHGGAGGSSTLSRTGNGRFIFQNSLLYQPASAVFPSMASRRSDVSRFSSPTTPIKPMSPSTNVCPIENSGRVTSSLRYRARLREPVMAPIATNIQPQFGLFQVPSNSPIMTSSSSTTTTVRPLAPHNYPTRYVKMNQEKGFGRMTSSSMSQLPQKRQ